MAKTYNSRDSLVVTYPTTHPPTHYLSIAERIGSLTNTYPINVKKCPFIVP
jgi:hypothetical protein